LGGGARSNEFCDACGDANCFCVVCRAKDCDTLQLSVDEDEEKELQVCQFVASFIFAFSASLVILSTEFPYLPECKTALI
jgi:hypothetical protein